MNAARQRWLTDGLDVGPDYRHMTPFDFPPAIPTPCRDSADSIVYQGPPPIVAPPRGVESSRMLELKSFAVYAPLI